MSEYWRDYWDRRVEAAGDNPYRQVGRTLNKQPMSEAMLLRIAAHFIEKLELDAHHSVLDVCCGNGLLGAEMARRCRSVTGVDFSTPLLASMALRASDNLRGVLGDVLEVEFRPGSFDRILFAAAIQHFSQPQAIRLFKKFALWLKPEGILLATDIPDASRMWKFYDSEERESLYFKNIMEETPILGTWFDRTWLEKLARHAGFSEAQAADQPGDYWYSEYRFDLLCRG